MKPQVIPNKWSCLPTAFAIALDLPVEQVIKELGHDGSEIIWKDLSDPFCRRSFHIQELIYYSYRKGLNVTEFQSFPQQAPFVNQSNPYKLDFRERLIEILQLPCIGVLTGFSNMMPHAVAWDGFRQIAYDNEERPSLENFRIVSFWKMDY